MMRLIDADAYLKKVCTYNKTGCGSCRLQDKCPVNEPTVDAIPIGWIEEQIRESYDASKEYDGCYDYAWYLSELVKRWREKNGTVD